MSSQDNFDLVMQIPSELTCLIDEFARPLTKEERCSDLIEEGICVLCEKGTAVKTAWNSEICKACGPPALSRYVVGVTYYPDA